MPSGLFLVGTNPSVNTFATYISPKLEERKWQVNDYIVLPTNEDYKLLISISAKGFLNQPNMVNISYDLEIAIKQGFINATNEKDQEEILNQGLVTILNIETHNNKSRPLNNYKSNFKELGRFVENKSSKRHFDKYLTYCLSKKE